METFNQSLINVEMSTLREGVKKKYRQYQALDRDRFPDFEYNTNRANYEPLRASFDEEFYVVRGIERNQSSIHIPSTNTLAQIFCDDSYTPSKKILNTCRSYAEGKSKAAAVTEARVATQSQAITPAKTRRLLLVGIVLLAGLSITIAINLLLPKLPASGLIMERPARNSTVPQELIAEGKVSNAKTVWLVVRYKKGRRYWVQPPINVQDNGWIGAIFIGGMGKEEIGLTYQIRAFVNPVRELRAEEVLYSWPEAELSTDVVEVVRGAEKE